MQRTILIAASAFILVSSAVAADAAQTPAVDAGPVVQNSQAMEQADTMQPMNIRQQIQSQLTKAGYTDVTITPSSFYVRAKDKQGNPMAMVIGPDTFTEVTEMAPRPATSNGAAAPNTAAPKVTAPAMKP